MLNGMTKGPEGLFLMLVIMDKEGYDFQESVFIFVKYI